MCGGLAAMSCILWHLVALLRAALRRPPKPKHKVPQGYSPADLPIRAKSGREWGPESAGSLTPIEMTNAYCEVIGDVGLREALLVEGADEFIKGMFSSGIEARGRIIKILSLSYSI
jgi:hypothetical protein